MPKPPRPSANRSFSRRVSAPPVHGAVFKKLPGWLVIGPLFGRKTRFAASHWWTLPARLLHAITLKSARSGRRGSAPAGDCARDFDLQREVDHGSSLSFIAASDPADGNRAIHGPSRSLA